MAKKVELNTAVILRGALAIADSQGLEPLTIRRLADELGSKPMSIYYHVANKQAIVAGMLELVFAEIEKPAQDGDWRNAIRERCLSARQVLNRHPWAAPIVDSFMPGPNVLEHHDAVIGCLRNSGMSLELTAKAFAAIDSYVYGFALQENNSPKGSGATNDAIDELEQETPDMKTQYPHLGDLIENYLANVDYSFADNFEFGLDLLLDGLEQERLS